MLIVYFSVLRCRQRWWRRHLALRCWREIITGSGMRSIEIGAVGSHAVRAKGHVTLPVELSIVDGLAVLL